MSNVICGILGSRFKHSTDNEQPLWRHAVLSGRAGLLAVNDRGAAERFDRTQISNYGVPFGHALRGYHERQL